MIFCRKKKHHVVAFQLNTFKFVSVAFYGVNLQVKMQSDKSHSFLQSWTQINDSWNDFHHLVFILKDLLKYSSDILLWKCTMFPRNFLEISYISITTLRRKWMQSSMVQAFLVKTRLIRYRFLLVKLPKFKNIYVRIRIYKLLQ